MYDLVELDGLAGAKYGNENLRRLLQDTFGGRKLQDLNPRVLVPSFRLDNQETDPANRSWNPKFFHNFPGEDNDGECLIADVAMASAAPTYFPSYGEYIDGGVIANNPSMAAIAQVLDGRNQPSDRGTLNEIKLLSVGTGSRSSTSRGKTGIGAMRNGLDQFSIS